ncbi:hypothetical protein LTR35_001628 [Friedmanniomyces endolithicus]|uniref:Ras GEF n=1 Tax=Friedmanniomyces endolithicus TaxID=329885 RepID=A0AAN6FSN5_9PEZI|nr:hypothetical protein LTR35_001628 [Friedmanniomyces endolithicus]KAK0321606.1 hypothetical protein LTR82_007574 [Friedmanniomyces endolithicus]KAK1011286.1 hypothetical protein LTR54_005204 [Friedmanniomyces endolithicus]
MPSSGLGGRDSRRSSKSGPSGTEAYNKSAASTERRSSKSGPTGTDALKSLPSERREKTKSSQSYTAAYSAARRGSVQPYQEGGLGALPERPRLKTRTHSAPVVDRAAQQNGQAHDPVPAQSEPEGRDFAQPASPGAMADGQDEDEVAGAVGAVRQYQHFQNSEVSEPLPEVNIAVIGAGGVGKSTFVQKALDLPTLPPSQAAERKIPIDGNVYLVRLLELPIDDVDIDEDDIVTWPDTIADKVMPRVDGAIALYNVQDKHTFDDIPEVLNAIHKACLPTVLISSKCDGERQLDPAMIEQKARRSISGIGTLQTNGQGVESQKRAIFMILKAVILGYSENKPRNSSPPRQRAQSTAVMPASPLAPVRIGHARATSEYTGSVQKDRKHARHDSSLAGYSSSTQLKVPKEVSEEDMHRSFLFEESASDASSLQSVRTSVSAEVAQQSHPGAPTLYGLSETGATCNELIERLLGPATSKADTKFSAVFLALYRKFAAPGTLLEAIVDRFDALEQDGIPSMTTTVSQLRYLSTLEQWVGQYPGDFAFPGTKRKMQRFITKVSQTRICSVSAKEIALHLNMAQDDDDTNWSYPDKDREMVDTSSSNTLTDELTSMFGEDFSGTTLGDDGSTIATAGGETIRSASGSSTTSSQIMASADAAQKAAKLLQPTPRRTITKDEWRMLMDQPDHLIARELTRMDWILISSIRPRDLVRHVSSFTEKARYKNLVNVNRVVEHFNHIAAWVSNFVLFRDKPKHRALMLEKFMKVARKLRELNNYNGLGAIIAGIKSSAVGRLVATRDLLPQDVGKDWLKLEILMSSSRSHAAYRLAWENTNGERIPYLPLHLRDLASAEQGNATFVGAERDGRVNWKKFEIMGEVVVSMQRAQGMPYKGLGGSRGELQIKELVLEGKLEKDEDILFARSQQLEASPGAGGTSEKLKQFFKR